MVGWWGALAVAGAQEPGESAFEAAKARHLRVQSAGMGVLAGWSAVNLAGGGVAWALADTPRREGFWGGNAAWNVVNLGIATAGLASVGGKRKAIQEPLDLLKSQQNLERSLLVNIGLDVAYVVAGLALRERGLRLDQPSLQGFGDALLAQGGFLFAFDIALFTASQRSRRRERYTVRFSEMP
ncbi:MAG: hypothetical protein AAF211_00245 [Myxococcota bacterium]